MTDVKELDVESDLFILTKELNGESSWMSFHPLGVATDWLDNSRCSDAALTAQY